MFVFITEVVSSSTGGNERDCSRHITQKFPPMGQECRQTVNIETCAAPIDSARITIQMALN